MTTVHHFYFWFSIQKSLLPVVSMIHKLPASCCPFGSSANNFQATSIFPFGSPAKKFHWPLSFRLGASSFPFGSTVNKFQYICVYIYIHMYIQERISGGLYPSGCVRQKQYTCLLVLLCIRFWVHTCMYIYRYMYVDI